jgi:hypothetical protein
MIGKINLSGYPRFYGTDYDISHIRIGSVDCTLLKVDVGINLPTVTKMVPILESKEGVPCMIQAPKLSDYQKKRLSDLDIAFFISPNNYYIPFLGALNRQLKNRPERMTGLSAQAQRLALHIIDGSWIGLSSTDVAYKMKKSLPSVSNYFREIEAAVPQTIEKQGTKKVLVNNDDLSKGELFGLFEPSLLTPVKDLVYAKFNGAPKSLIGQGCLFAGLSALSMKTMLVDDRWKTYAISKYERSCLDRYEKDLIMVTESDDPDVLIQIWGYPPENKGDDAVDDVSLYLSLKESQRLKDPRGREALEILRKRITG